MTIDVLSIFPDMFTALDQSIIARAREAGILNLQVHDIRAYSSSKHRNTDDYPFGGGAGMVMTAQPIADAIREIAPDPYPGKRIFLSPRGKTLTQSMAVQLSRQPALLLLCGHYEGVDERILERYIDMEISIGDYILTGGELPAMVLIDTICRLLPGVLGAEESHQEESFSDDYLLEYPHYTRPRVFEGMEVPQVLLDGNHALIEQWRRQQRLLLTKERRPDLLDKARLTEKERAWLKEQ